MNNKLKMLPADVKVGMTVYNTLNFGWQTVEKIETFALKNGKQMYRFSGICTLEIRSGNVKTMKFNGCFDVRATTNVRVG